MLQRKRPHGFRIMTTLIIAVIAAGAANVALVAFMADRFGPKAGTSASAGEFVAITQGTPATAKARAVRVGNENALAGTAAIAA